MGHSLKKLWRAYKNSHPKADLKCHDKTINGLDKFEEIRYPNPGQGSTAIQLEWTSYPAELKTFAGLKTPKQFVVIVSDIDDLIVDVLKTFSWNPGVIMGINKAALEAIKRENKHADFLTTIIAPRMTASG
jgi:hypothetical protein